MELEYVTYVVLGFLLTSTNTLIFTTIMIHKALRNHKEYALMGMLVFFNSILGIGFVSAGLHRFFEDPVITNVTRTTCLTLPHVYLFSGTPCTISLLLPFIALDRLVAVMKPLFYYSLHEQYSYLIVFVMSILHICFFFFDLHLILSNPELVPSHCDYRELYEQFYKRFEICVIVFGHFLAVVIYIAVIFAFQNRTRVKLISDHRCLELVHRRRSRIIQTFGLFAVMTFCIVVLPFVIVLTIDCLLDSTSPYRKNLDDIYMIGTKVALLNPTLNVVIYALRHNEIYMGMKTMLRGQAMPDSTEQWRVREVFPSLKGNSSFQGTPKHVYSLAHYQMLKQLAEEKTRRQSRNSTEKSDSCRDSQISQTRV